MSTGQTVTLVLRRSQPCGLSAVLAAHLPPSTLHFHQWLTVSYTDQFRHLQEPQEHIARKHAQYGHHRAAMKLRVSYGRRVNRKLAHAYRVW